MPTLGPDDRPGYRNLPVVEGYDHWAPSYDSAPNPLIALEESVTLEVIGDVRGRRILDLGCGTGRYCALLAARGATVIGLDPSKGMLQQARRKAGALDIELRRGTIEEAGFPAAHFDLVLSALTLSHIPHLEPALREVARVLRGGGCLVISDIHPYWPASGHNYTEFFDETGQEFRIPEYPHLVEEYWRLFDRLGMRLEDIREPTIDDSLVARFPSLRSYRGIPLALILKARKRPAGW